MKGSEGDNDQRRTAAALPLAMEESTAEGVDVASVGVEDAVSARMAAPPADGVSEKRDGFRRRLAGDGGFVEGRGAGGAAWAAVAAFLVGVVGVVVKGIFGNGTRPASDTVSDSVRDYYEV